MDIYLHNTLSDQKELFKSLEKNKVAIYNCGPTVYDTIHIGNLRSFLMYDILRRIFEYSGYFVTQVMNITDIDDKTIKKSQDENKSLEELTRHYETLFIADLHALNILTPHRLLRATDHIKEMIEMISILLEKGIAYPTRDGVYFSIGLFKNYGRLAKIDLKNEVRERISNDEYEKENPRDFVLWKFGHEFSYDAPFGKGRPGWHIECSAMSTWALGETIDIHTGGTDLIFPHHTNEIAQSESATEKPFVHYWIHGAYMNVNDSKMSKSKGNFIKLKDIEEAGISPLAFRYWLLTSHYRTPINFTLEAIKGAQNAFIRLIEAFIRLNEMKNEHIHSHGKNRNYKEEFQARINDDMDMPRAIAITWDMIKDHSVEAKKKVSLLLDFDKIFGFGLKAVMEMKENENKKIPLEIVALAEAREIARKAGEYNKADALRKEMDGRGYEVKDMENRFEIQKK